MNMSLHGSMIANFLIKKANEDIDSNQDDLNQTVMMSSSIKDSGFEDLHRKSGKKTRNH